MYLVGEDDLFLNPTAEVPVTNIHRDEILEPGAVPRYLTAYCASYRREAGAAGADTRGMVRVHQFDKVELVKIVPPETSYDEHERLARDVADIFEALELPYRVVLLCSGDMSFAAAKCYDFETWASCQQAWLEVSSCSNFRDFQARRAQIRYRNEKGKTGLVHTLTGSGLALARALSHDYPINADIRTLCVTKLVEVLENSTKPRDINPAIMALANLERLNISKALANRSLRECGLSSDDLDEQIEALEKSKDLTPEYRNALKQLLLMKSGSVIEGVPCDKNQLPAEGQEGRIGLSQDDA